MGSVETGEILLGRLEYWRLDFELGMVCISRIFDRISCVSD
jgi:hypothetical protein